MILNAKKQLLSLKGKILLGLSGGPDSMCLCQLLIESNINFHIAHVDHGLQKESELEKNRLQKFANQRSIPFHCCTLDSSNFPKSNLEEVLREKRLDFFETIMQENSLDLLLLGHQKDEKVETMIKRFFEGGNLLNLCGIKKDSKIRKITIIRPLLDVAKASIIEYLEKRNISYYIDPSNFSDKNLRAKMRVGLIPMLENKFGKNILSSVADLGDQIEDLSTYVEKKISILQTTGVKGVFGIYYPYVEGVDNYIYRLYILDNLRKKGICISRDQRKFIKDAIETKLTGKIIPFCNHLLYFDVHGIFLVDKEKDKMIPAIVEKNINWIDFWKNGMNNPHIKKITSEEYLSLINRKKINDYHRKKHTPIWLRHLFPIPLTTINKNIKIKAQ